jgi:hypothetical protein
MNININAEALSRQVKRLVRHSLQALGLAFQVELCDHVTLWGEIGAEAAQLARKPAAVGDDLDQDLVLAFNQLPVKLPAWTDAE